MLLILIIKRIEESDIEKGLAAYSTDLLRDISYELVDVSGINDDILYAFIGSKSLLTKTEVRDILQEYGVNEDSIETIFDLLLWYGFLGIEGDDESHKYIYNFNYKMPLMKGIIKKKGSDLLFTLNQAFWPALMIDA